MLLKLRTLCVVSVVYTKRKHQHKDSSKFLPCPSPKIVESFLNDSVGFESHVSEQDMLCCRCYKYFNQLLKSGVCTLSSNHIISELSHKEVSLEETVHILNTSETSESAVLLALNKTALHMCRRIQSDHAVLFPHLYALFLSYLPSDVDNSVSISKHRLLSFVWSEFGDLVSSYCHNKKVGTVFHRTKADLHVLLSNALHKQSKDSSDTSSLLDKLNDSVHELSEHFVNKTSSVTVGR